MILTGPKIKREVQKGCITIEPFKEEHITTNTYDLELGGDYLEYIETILDPSKENKFRIKKIPKSGLLLKKGDFILAHSKEIIGSDKYVPMIHAKSGIARLGLFVHVTADLIDIGSKGNTTFQLYATQPIKIYPGMKIGQVSFWVTKGKIKLYKGKYQGSKGPLASKSFEDFNHR